LGPLAGEEGLGASNPSYAASALLAVTGITVRGDVIGRAVLAGGNWPRELGAALANAFLALILFALLD